MTEKIFAAHAREGRARAGEVVSLTPEILLLNDISGPVAFQQFDAMGAVRPFDPDRIVLVADHFSPAKDVLTADSIKILRAFADRHHIDHYYDTGNGGIEHTLLAELGLVCPGSLVFGADSHTCTAGAFNASGMGFGSTDLAAVLALGELWAQVPDAIRVDLAGSPGPFVTGKDVILTLIERIGSDGALDMSLEFGGPGLFALNVDERMAVANMAVEAGAETCVMEADEQLKTFVEERGASARNPVVADPAASYAAHETIELDRLEPIVAAPPSPANGMPVSSLAGTRVDQVYIGNCSNGTLTDLRQAAQILTGRKVARGVRMIIVPATQKIYRAALREGLLEIFSEAGANISPPTCGACFGGHMGILADGETAIATTNRNFRGRMGHPGSRVFLANAWVAAAAAVTGEIRHPADVVGGTG
jgi:3-isopropylmalate/(R)-2-methylmalate dehydratase large subunit